MSDSNTFQASFFHPRYWLLWLGFIVWWLLAMLPYPILLLLGKSLGLLLYAVGSRRKEIAARNIELCFPDLDAQQRQTMLRQNFQNLGMAFFETGMAWWWPNWRFRRLVKVEGLEHLEALQGQGALLTAIHLTTLEIGASAVCMNFTIDGMHRPHKNAFYDYVQKRGRQQRSDSATSYPRKEVRQVLKALRKGRVIWYAPDQDYGIKQGVFAPFMGIQAATVTATSRFAGAGNAKIVPLTQQRLPGWQGYQVTIHPPLEGFPSGDDLEDAITINNLIESIIKEQPDSYMWVHRRFKTRPEGESSLYS